MVLSAHEVKKKKRERERERERSESKVAGTQILK